VRVRRSHELGLSAAKSRVVAMAPGLEDRFSLSSKWDGDTLRFSGNGLNGSIDVAEEWIEVKVSLGFALSFLESSIRAELEQALRENLE